MYPKNFICTNLNLHVLNIPYAEHEGIHESGSQEGFLKALLLYISFIKLHVHA